ncbi:MAG: galactokinase [Chitinophagaceae bacterium]|nr:galactokinase [Chitinophagaceae bacterium]MCW5929800.1 galactokinase [Chitinophagaceae bacterium]
MSSTDKVTIKKQFIEIFGAEPLLFRSPGRINIIGEHTDYNEGFVLPAAIDKAAYVAISKRADGAIHLYSRSFNESFQSSPDEMRPRSSWTDYVLGVADQLKRNRYPLQGFNLLLDGDIYIGAGLSSSAAVECCVLYALNELFGFGLSRMEIVKMAQLAEHEFAGVKCGIMDQFASVFGRANHAVRLDCRTLDYEYVPLDLNGYKIVLLNTNVKHSLAGSEYNTRRQQCEQGVAWVAEAAPGVLSLRDVTITQLDQYVKPKDELIYTRCRYVVEENQRLQNACGSLQKGDLEGLGKNMFGSHEGLSRQYEVSCKELDWLVDFVKDDPGVLGARMMGGGFGGCTINLVKERAIAPLIERAGKAYKNACGLDMEAYVVQTADGTGELDTR